MLDYDREAAHYDETRGGLPRAEAAAGAVRGLVPGGTLLDVACGTGLVSGELARRGLRVLGVDASAGMAGVAAGRVPVVLGDGFLLPVGDGSVDAVTTIWLLHLLDDARPVIAEAARVVRPGGVYVTTVDKRAAHEGGRRGRPADGAELVVAEAARHGLRQGGEATFVGHGQGRDGPDPVFRLLAFTRDR
ncbi:methyltransferase domain-containing protein [Nonomuraea sp. KC401]|uniref:class I SAM-dependent methyltransferase n=1 Tax=unclassified Nonomuraea TaxID=2593643 RepID=UPI0010FE8A9E|nr:class I SAM-dependent methyltransferase [Nonomuraea sp. KC401]NBE96825.1 methyltransferase domain-containing protein [Nonomuraea sp. K271]TLF68025.1 methyltransferase domain-containing protein [Nonomuraea sp. KC401]